MTECRRTVEQLAPFVDGVLPPDERAHVERHLSECPPCRRVATEVEGGRTVLRERAGHLRDAPLHDEPLPLGLRARCEALAREQTGRWSQIWYRRFAPTLAIAVLLLATTSVLFALATRRSDVLLAQQLTLDHMKCFTLFGSRAVPVDAHAAEATFASRHGWDVHVPATSTQEGLTLVGARRCLYASGPIPHVMYRVKGQNLSLFVLDGVTRSPAEVVTLGYRSQIWSEKGRTYVLVTPRDSMSLERAVHYVMEQAH
jgi:anti-sigma factor RsiW